MSTSSSNPFPSAAGLTARVLFCGTPEFAAVQLRALLSMSSQVSVVGVLTQPDRPAGRGQQLTASPVKQLALEHSIPVFQPQSLKKEAEGARIFLQSIGPLDIAVVAAYGLIVPQWFLDTPKHGCVNVHGSILPRWRGAAPIHRAILAGDRETGICLMKMEAGLDTGPVFAQSAVPILDADTTGTLHDKLARLGATLLTEHLLPYIAGQRPLTPQPVEGVTYAEKIQKDEAAINWLQPVAIVERQIRAFNPAPGAFTTRNSGERLKVWSGSIVKDHSFLQTLASANMAPGVIIRNTDAQGDSEVIVCCGADGTSPITFLRLDEVQAPGSKRAKTKDYLRGVNIQQGDRLGL